MLEAKKAMKIKNHKKAKVKSQEKKYIKIKRHDCRKL